MNVQQESQTVIERELLRAHKTLKERGEEINDKNLLVAFCAHLEIMLTDHFTQLREILTETKSREEILFQLLHKVEGMIKYLIVYKDNLDKETAREFEEYLKTINETLLEKYKNLVTEHHKSLTINYN